METRGFKDSEVAISAASDVDTDDDLPLVILAKSKQLFNCTFQELADSDASVPTCEEGSLNWTRPTSELLKKVWILPPCVLCQRPSNMFES